MIENKSKDTVTETPVQESGAPPSLGRRRLVKGLAAAAPAIFTLYSGNARAMLSTYQCIVKDREAFDDTSQLVTRVLTDGNQRIPAEIIEIAKGGEDNRFLAVVPGSDGNHYFELGQVDPYIATWSNYSDKDWTLESNDKFSPPSTSDATGKWDNVGPVVGESAHSLFCVDDSGGFVSVYPADCGADTPVTMSCWTSFA